MKWTADQIPDQNGQLAIVTGANSGLGLITARELARHGATVVLAARNTTKAQDAAAEIGALATGEKPVVRALDLSNLASVREFAAEYSNQRIDLLINNAGVMMTPHRTTVDGFELQLGTNHLGHFALTGLLLDPVQHSDAGRIVTVTSNEHKAGRIDFDDLQLEHSYNPRRAYRQSKLANAIFAIELDRRLRATRSPAISVLAHPGYSATNLQSTGPTGLLKAVLAISNRIIAQNAELGALPILYAATAPGAKGGSYWGPDGFQEMRGHPTQVRATPSTYDPEIGRRLWEASERLTGVSYLDEAGVSRTA